MYGDGGKEGYKKITLPKQKGCKECSLRGQCFTGSRPFRKIKRVLFHITMKRAHNLAKTYKRGIRNTLEHCLSSALALNIKHKTND
ncbi:hypothetical protein EDM55_09420 [Brevibacillus centrosporus]|nr:hypothetical protein EDM55_09420 [Brevibacillus centrosporus]